MGMYTFCLFIYIILIYFIDLDQSQERSFSFILEEKRVLLRQEALEFEETKRLIQANYDICLWCLFNYKARHSHTLFECREKGYQARLEVYQGFRDYLRNKRILAPYTACFYYFLPQDLCRRWKGVEGRGFIRDKKENRCSFPDFLISTIAIGFSIPQYTKEYYIRVYGLNGQEDEEKKGLYLGKKVEYGGVEVNQLFLEFSLALRIILEKD